jgi:hypothetical protein
MYRYQDQLERVRNTNLSEGIKDLCVFQWLAEPPITESKTMFSQSDGDEQLRLLSSTYGYRKSVQRGNFLGAELVSYKSWRWRCMNAEANGTARERSQCRHAKYKSVSSENN